MAKTETVKNLALRTIAQLPEDASLEQIMYEVHFISKVLQGHDDAENGRVASIEELQRLRQAWQQ